MSLQIALRCFKYILFIKINIISNCLCYSVQVNFVILTACNINLLECGPMPNLMVALPNIGGALCSMPQSFADAHYYTLTK